MIQPQPINNNNTTTKSRLLKFASFNLSTTTTTTLEQSSSLSLPRSCHTSNSSTNSTSSQSILSLSPSPNPIPTHHEPSGNGFRNPWPSAIQQPSNALLNSLLTRGLPIELARKPQLDSSIKPIIKVPAQLELYDGFSPQDWRTRASTNLIATWLGHAGCLVQLPTAASSLNHAPRPFRVIFDPIFSTRAGPSAFTGPKRLIGPPCRVSDLPLVDICCISHSHYDHLDYETVKELIKLQSHLKFYVPLGLKAWFATMPIPAEQVIEMDWWDSNHFQSDLTTSLVTDLLEQVMTPTGQSEEKQRAVRIHCVPAQHSSGRSLLDQNTSLWCGWVIEQDFEDRLPSPDEENMKTTEMKKTGQGKSSVYFAGDTGYRSSLDPSLCCPAFSEIGEKYGPIDFSMIPIWRGGSLSFISWAGLRLADENLLATHHASPTDAVKIHQEVRSRHSIAVHHGCFIGSGQESLEALEELKSARIEAGVGDWMEEGGFGAIDVGVTVEVDILR